MAAAAPKYEGYSEQQGYSLHEKIPFHFPKKQFYIIHLAIHK